MEIAKLKEENEKLEEEVADLKKLNQEKFADVAAKNFIAGRNYCRNDFTSENEKLKEENALALGGLRRLLIKGDEEIEELKKEIEELKKEETDEEEFLDSVMNEEEDLRQSEDFGFKDVGEFLDSGVMKGLPV
jgi:cell division protein FtsB